MIALTRPLPGASMQSSQVRRGACAWIIMRPLVVIRDFVSKFQILVTVGQHIDILGEEHDLSSLIGEHIDMDPQLFHN
jgi:hypothetical protein